MDLLAITPRFLVMAARAAVLPCLGALAGLVLTWNCTPALAAAATFALAVVVLQAMPRVRASDLLGGVALFVTMLEWSRAGTYGPIDAVRWQAMIAVPGAMVVLVKVQHLRTLARQDAYVPLRQLERRRAVLSRRPARSPFTKALK